MIARAATSGPERTCLGCRKRDGQGALVRLVADGGRVVIDGGRSRPGRGVWVHRDRTCAKRLAVGALAHALRVPLLADALTGIADAIVATPALSQLPPVRPANQV